MNENIAALIKPGHEIINEYRNMRVKDLKKILNELPDDKELYKIVEKACQKAINLAGEKRGEAIDDSRNPWQKI